MLYYGIIRMLLEKTRIFGGGTSMVIVTYKDEDTKDFEVCNNLVESNELVKQLIEKCGYLANDFRVYKTDDCKVFKAEITDVKLVECDT